MATSDQPDMRPADAALAGDDPRVIQFLGPAHAAVSRFAEMLADQGVTRGLLGPREVPRLWERHLVNSATVAALLPGSGMLVDVGSGAGLPGVVLGAMRPDLHVVLLEPMERRVVWLREVVDALGLTSVEVTRGRAEELHGSLHAEAATARAVAPMDRLVRWTLPLLRPGGVLLAMKGDRAADELVAAESAIRKLGGGSGEVIDATAPNGLPGTRVVRVVRERETVAQGEASRSAPRAKSRSRRIRGSS